MKKQRILSLVFALVLLLGTATACGKKEEAKKPTESGIATLAAAKAAIEAGDYEDAYRYLITDESAEATELLSKFAFVPVEHTFERDGEADSKTVYTYDENGNLLSVNDDGTYAYDHFTYTYDDQGRMVFAKYTEGYEVTLSYDETGCTITHGSEWTRIENDLLESYPSSHESATAENGWCDKGVWHILYNEKRQILGYKLVCTVCDVEETEAPHTYDEQGRLLTVDNGINGKDIYTYDEQGRLLTKYNGGYRGTWIKDSYTYDENGNKIKWEYESCSWADSDYQEDADPEYILITGCSVYTYDEKGNLIKAEGTGYWQDQYWFTDEVVITGRSDLSEYTLNITYDSQGRITESEIDSIDKYSDGREYRTYRKETYTYDSDGTCTILCTDENNVTLGKRINYADGSNEQWRKNADDSELSLKRYQKFDEFGNRIEEGNNSAKSTDTYQLVYYPEGIPTLYMREDVMPDLAVRQLWRINISMPEFARRAVNFTREEWFRYAHLCEVLGIEIPS